MTRHKKILSSSAPRPIKRPDNAPQRPAGNGIMLFGLHAVSAAWLNPERTIKRLWLTEGGKRQMDSVLAKTAGQKNRPAVELVDNRVIDKLLGPLTVHQGIAIEAEPLPEKDLEDIIAMDSPLLVMLDQVTDPHNVGAILRSASAFGAGAVLMTDRHAAASTGTLAKTASGALDVTPLVRVPNLAQAMAKLQKESYWCVGLDESGPSALHDVKLPPKVVIVLGAEGEGLRRLTRESCDEIAKLPTKPPIGSLNVSNAAAVAIYEVNRQISAKLSN